MRKIFLFIFWINTLVIGQQLYFSNVTSISTRLKPNQDIVQKLTRLLSIYTQTALSISSAVGSVKYCWLRNANQTYLSYVPGPLQITSLTGTFDIDLSPHLHIQLSNGKGQSFGGHLPSLEERQNFHQQQKDCPIFTTLQIVLLSHKNIVYKRKVDPQTTFHELTIDYINKKVKTYSI